MTAPLLQGGERDGGILDAQADATEEHDAVAGGCRAGPGQQAGEVAADVRLGVAVIPGRDPHLPGGRERCGAVVGVHVEVGQRRRVDLMGKWRVGRNGGDQRAGREGADVDHRLCGGGAQQHNVGALDGGLR
ncbi:MAG: hypothetical protein V9E82_06095 [Candidatus Nanopelagicales bacterium]